MLYIVSLRIWSMALIKQDTYKIIIVCLCSIWESDFVSLICLHLMFSLFVYVSKHISLLMDFLYPDASCDRKAIKISYSYSYKNYSLYKRLPDTRMTPHKFQNPEKTTSNTIITIKKIMVMEMMVMVMATLMVMATVMMILMVMVMVAAVLTVIVMMTIIMAMIMTILHICSRNCISPG